MNILYVSLSYVPSRRASSVQVMKMCQALARTGAKVTLVTKGSRARQEPGIEDDYRFYGVDPVFKIVKLPRPGVSGGGLVFSYFVRRLLRRRRRFIDIVYAREIGAALSAARLGLPVVLEVHSTPVGPVAEQFHQLLHSQHLLRIVVISRALQQLLTAEGRIPAGVEVLLAPDAADPPNPAPEPRFEAHMESSSRPEYGYVGQLYPGKGMEVLVPLARLMPGADFHVVGGHREDLDHWRKVGLPENLHLHGFVAPSEVPGWHTRCDALLLPSQSEVYGASRGVPIGDVMSPLKLFEYMASGKPIVSSDLPVLREILRHGENALLVPPHDVVAWKEALEQLDSDPSLAHNLAQRARQDLTDNYTWDARATSVLRGL